MAREEKTYEQRLKELEISLEEERNLSKARSTLLEANIKELDSVYRVLNEKLKDLRSRDERIRGFEAELVRANKLSSLGELAGSIAHEIKNPLVSIEGFARRMTKTADKDKITEYAELIEHESVRLSNLLSKLLDFSRMDDPKPEPAELGAIVDDTVLFMEHHITRFKGVGIIVEKERQKAYVNVDKIHIQQVLVNLINNAAQAMPGGGTIHIKSGIEGDSGYIAITDEGEGVAEEIVDRIFEPFFTTKPKGEGTGLGLSLSKKLVEANNGRIELITAKRQGSTFRLLLPLTTNSADNP